MSHDSSRPFDDDFDPFEDDEADDDEENPFANGSFAPLEASDDFDAEADFDDPLLDDPFAADPFESDPFDDDSFEIPTEVAPNPHARCGGCGTTWDRIRHDGRAGCAACYATFREQLSGVMARVQRGESHAGKTPRAIEKRHLRLEQLRQRRDNQLAVLEARLHNAIAAEKYEEAAKLRDKIKIVSSTIVS